MALDPETLDVKEAKLFSDLSTRQQIGRSVKSLHTGEIFGQFTKFLWFLACVVATSLPITGTLIWWNKHQKKKHSKPKRAVIPRLNWHKQKVQFFKKGFWIFRELFFMFYRRDAEGTKRNLKVFLLFCSGVLVAHRLAQKKTQIFTDFFSKICASSQDISRR
ncbi:PepSY-associated TM helix domain-containing protein [Algoriphagus boritolerans]|uniref:PepSY-associated TM helix domain-containing protein n=1 Tax=Algoriphagus boritolerans TaxID=308111 RepID=UPI000AC6E2B8